MGLFASAKDTVIDAWSWLNYKPLYSDTLGMPNRRAFPEAHATWVPAADERRLSAYKLLTAYDNNQVAELSAYLDGDSARERREFGDPSMFVDTITSHVLGDEQTITVPGAEQADGGASSDAATAERVQTLLREWADEELLPMRLLQAERKAVGLGDGVLLLHWDADKQRVRVRTYDPGFYFPVLDEDSDGSDFPDRIHFAWELPEDKKRRLPARLRRITYHLDWIRPQAANGVDRTGRPVRATVMSEPTDETPEQPLLGRGDLLDSGGAITRMYPWSEQPSYKTVYLTDAIWELGDLKGPVDVDDLPMDKARFATNGQGEVLDHLDMLIDFLPVIHVPNTVPAAGEHWGQSSLAKVLQVFDELSGSDTDSSRASATTGSPILAISGKAINGQQQYTAGPGMVLTLGDGGSITSVDTSANLAELRNHRKDLRDQAAAAARIPAVALGMGDPAQFDSGYQLELALGPLDSLISAMRLARDHADRLLPKFVQRLFQAGQHPDWIGLPVLPAKLTRGAYTPTDKAAVLEEVTKARTAGLISLETAIRRLQEIGWPVDDIEQEIKQIEARAFEDARMLADALGNPEEVAAFLGRQAPDEPETPTVQLPFNALPPGDEDPEETVGQGSQGNT
ncbi:hypothetical protein [Streptomyces caniscabiei]|uniref:Portal protein n=1 Tax=Streptomyces caniscabiei TaxID=2746961 RepID=A0ABU4MYQ4_9ACTN|nr:hypothetical protein [Streptomyces caniscabiei]MBE4790361.1 hypothetical protein [Streptomyces caniscabiei]MBE4799536.1 hypothetical protein [Streptomyces caniscabiei]MDX3015219.1 hypothetical protein [Streptomyces caniscabiei]MDX3042534.1 hypothetical protein [Streptomyces caniscabiei]